MIHNLCKSIAEPRKETVYEEILKKYLKLAKGSILAPVHFKEDFRLLDLWVPNFSKILKP